MREFSEAVGITLDDAVADAYVLVLNRAMALDKALWRGSARLKPGDNNYFKAGDGAPTVLSRHQSLALTLQSPLMARIEAARDSPAQIRIKTKDKLLEKHYEN